MKKSIYILLLLCCSLFTTTVLAQDWEQVEVPLTNPNASGQLVINLIAGGIEVMSHAKENVVVEVRPKSGTRNKHKQQTKNGLQKVANSSLKYSVREIDNKVVVSHFPGSKTLEFRVKVPKNFSLNLKTINQGAILVENVIGEHEISNTNGKVTLKNIGGSAIVDALNQNITVSFSEVAANNPMAFTSLNGTVDISFPASIKATIDAKSEFGDVYSDFNIQLDKTPVKGSKSKDGLYNVTRKKGITGTINGGGSQINFKTLNGDIFIRSN